jgi:hypothetical protein
MGRTREGGIDGWFQFRWAVPTLLSERRLSRAIRKIVISGAMAMAGDTCWSGGLTYVSQDS